MGMWSRQRTLDTTEPYISLAEGLPPSSHGLRLGDWLIRMCGIRHDLVARAIDEEIKFFQDGLPNEDFVS